MEMISLMKNNIICDEYIINSCFDFIQLTNRNIIDEGKHRNVLSS